MRIADDWLTAAPTQAVMAMLSGAGHRALVVGGCVRDALIGARLGRRHRDRRRARPR